MRHTVSVVIAVVVMIALIVGIDVAFLRDRALLRLAVNVGIVVVFGLAYIAVRRHL